MRELNLTQEPASEIGGGAVVRSPEERAAVAKERVMAVYRSGVAPTYEYFISKREDGTSCACVIGSLAMRLGDQMVAEKRIAEGEADFNREARTALATQVCQATNDFSLSEVLSLEEGYMGWRHGRISAYYPGFEKTQAFYQAGQEIAKEAFGRV